MSIPQHVLTGKPEPPYDGSWHYVKPAFSSEIVSGGQLDVEIESAPINFIYSIIVETLSVSWGLEVYRKNARTGNILQRRCP